MDNDVIKKCLGKNCRVLCAGSGGINVVIGKIIDVTENWIEVETKKKSVLVNTEFTQTIEID